ncbi:ACT domain-containing protein [Gammaproteobacteria bacterium]|nr:ACT domain-containing protein [Gammaproteobacteria bacterium]
MVGITDLESLLSTMSPELDKREFVFCSLDKLTAEVLQLKPIGTFQEEEGVTLVLERGIADQSQLGYSGVFKKITLKVHSSLEAVGLTAAVSNALASNGISANVIAAYYHDHIFVPAKVAASALEILQLLSKK